MKNVSHDVKIDLEEEFSALIEFTQSRWSVPANLFNLLKPVWDAAVKSLDGMVIVSSESSVNIMNNVSARQQKGYKDIPSEATGLASRFDKLHNLHMNTIMTAMRTKQNMAGSVEKEKITKKLYQKILFDNQNIDFDDFKPLGWESLLKDYVDYAGFDQYDKISAKESAEFSGHYDNYRSFPRVISLPNVMYSAVYQNQKPFYSLVHAVYEQALFCAEHNASLDIEEELNKINDYYSQKNPENKIIFDIPVQQLTKNKSLIQVYIDNDFTVDEVEFNKSVKRAVVKAEQNKELSEEERVQNKQNALKNVIEHIQSKKNKMKP